MVHAPLPCRREMQVMRGQVRQAQHTLSHTCRAGTEVLLVVVHLPHDKHMTGPIVVLQHTHTVADVRPSDLSSKRQQCIKPSTYSGHSPCLRSSFAHRGWEQQRQSMTQDGQDGDVTHRARHARASQLRDGIRSLRLLRPGQAAELEHCPLASRTQRAGNGGHAACPNNLSLLINYSTW